MLSRAVMPSTLNTSAVYEICFSWHASKYFFVFHQRSSLIRPQGFCCSKILTQCQWHGYQTRQFFEDSILPRLIDWLLELACSLSALLWRIFFGATIFNWSFCSFSVSKHTPHDILKHRGNFYLCWLMQKLLYHANATKWSKQETKFWEEKMN